LRNRAELRVEFGYADVLDVGQQILMAFMRNRLCDVNPLILRILDALSVSAARTSTKTLPMGLRRGFDNLDIGVNYMAYRNAPQEFMALFLSG